MSTLKFQGSPFIKHLCCVWISSTPTSLKRDQHFTDSMAQPLPVQYIQQTTQPWCHSLDSADLFWGLETLPGATISLQPYLHLSFLFEGLLHGAFTLANLRGGRAVFFFQTNAFFCKVLSPWYIIIIILKKIRPCILGWFVITINCAEREFICPAFVWKILQKGPP